LSPRHDGRIVHKAVDSSESGHRFLNQGCGNLGIFERAHGKGGIASNLSRQLLRLIAAAPMEHDPRTLTREDAHHPFANPSGRPGHQDDLVFQARARRQFRFRGRRMPYREFQKSPC